MAYCTNADVAAEFKDIAFTSTTAIKDTEVDEFIVQADAQINSAISSRYVVPVVAPAMALSILKTISIWKVKCRINGILSVKSPIDLAKQEPEGKSVCEQAQDMLDDIVDGTMPLPNAELSGGTGGMESFLMDEDVTYKFQRDSDAW